ncbi:hypothetical protein ACFL9T_16895 [Thermodesulfobacteriota bacterium]
MTMGTILGLLLLAFILAVWLGAPDWFAGSIWIFFLAVIGIGVVGYIRHSAAMFRRVHFADAETNKRFGRSLPKFWIRRRRHAPIRRSGAFRVWVAVRGLQLTIIALFPATFAVAIAGIYVEHKWLSMAMVLGSPALGLAMLYRVLTASQKARRHRRRVRAPDAADVLRKDQRPPVLLLRAFRADELDANAANPSDLPITFEEFIVQPLERYGPVVAIGRPGDELPPLGAYREYVAEDWQGRVRELLDATQMIVVVLDDTPGLQWELEQVWDLGLRQRLLVIVQSDDGRDLGALDRREAQQSLAREGITAPPRGKTLALVFDADGEPLSIIGSHRNAEYYRDAVRLGAKFIRDSATRT